MDELVTIIDERRAAITHMREHPHQKHKSLLVQEQRKRNERENWILRVLKTLKMPSPEQKKIIFDTSLKIMNYYQPITAIYESEGANYIETFINLFVGFYNKFDNMDLNHVKTIIRPNNGYIVVDLIKTLVDLGRKQFKNAIQDQFKQARLMAKSQRKVTEKSGKREFSPLKNENGRNCQQVQNNKTKRVSLQEIGKRINYSLFEKYSRVIESYNPQATHERFNQLYFDLLYLNNKNALKIQKYLDHCFGTKRTIIYDASGLYTQEEMKKMANQQQEKTKNRAAELKELKGKCSPQQLRQYFKIKVEMHQSLNSIPNYVKNPQIRTWFPIVMLKNGDKLHPYSQMIEINGVYCEVGQFEDKSGKKLKAFLKEFLGEQFEKIAVSRCDSEAIFNRKDYLDYNNSKINELLSSKDQRKQKQTFLPPIGNSSVQIDIRSSDNQKAVSKAKSQTKLPNTTVMLPQHRVSENMEQALSKRMNHSTLIKNTIPSKRRMDNIIDTIIRSREYTIN